ncbi:MAG: c-type cytochrome [Sandaracinaceae bacterium]|nr:c-type cytochrome [Sandaracinaceae bacterium]
MFSAHMPPRSAALALVLVVMILTGCEQPAEVVAAPTAKVSLPGAPLYARYCALCHGGQGEGAAADHANALTNPLFLGSATDTFLFESIRRGRPGTPMSAFGVAAGGPLSDDEVRDVIAFLRSFQHTGPNKEMAPDAPPDLERAQRARPVFATHCVSCHGARGEGLLAPSLNNPVFSELVSDHLLTQAITAGRPGTPMVAFGDTLSAEQVGDLVHLIRTLSRPVTPAVTTSAGGTEAWATDRDIPIVIHPEGEAPSFSPANGYVSAAEVNTALTEQRRMVLLDARAVSDWRSMHLPGALPAPFYDDTEALGRVPRDGTQVVVYCGCPHAAADRVASRLREMGYERVAVIDEGLFFWRDQGYPLVSEPGGGGEGRASRSDADPTRARRSRQCSQPTC